MKHYLRFILVLLLSTVWCVGGYAQTVSKVTDISNIVSGQKYYIGATIGSTDYYLSLASTSLSQSVKGTGIVDKTKANTFIFDGSDKSWSIKIDGTDFYLSLKTTKDNGNVQVVKSAVTFTLSNKNGLIRITKGSFSIQKNNDANNTNFGSYKNTQKDVWLEPVGTSSDKTTTTLSFPNEATSFATTDDLTSFKGKTATLKAGETELTGKTIEYSKSGDDIFSSFNEADGTLALNGNAGTATVTAKFAGDDTYASSTASYTVTVKEAIKDIATLKPLITASAQSFTLKLTDAVVTYVNRNSAYIQDATAGIFVYASGHGLKNNQKINGLVDIKALLYSNLPEISSWALDASAEITNDATFDIETVTIADLNANYSKYESKPVKIAGAIVTSEFVRNKAEISQDGNTYLVFNKGGSDVTLTKNDNIDIIGYPTRFNDEYNLYLWKQSNVKVNSTLVATTLSFDPATTEYNVDNNNKDAFTAPTATVKDAEGNTVEGAAITYTSSEPSVATVGETDGKVTFVGFGTTVITASYAGDATHMASSSSYTINYGKVKTTMSWSATTATANLGEEFTNAPTLSLTADNVSILEGKTIKYTSTDENVAMVDENGTVTLKDKEGTTTITATFAGDETYAEASASYTLTVKDPNKLEVTFDFTKPENYGYGVTSGNTAFGEGKGDVPENATLTEGIVTLKNTTCSGSGTRFYIDGLRTYDSNAHTLYVPAGYRMTSISFSFGNNNTKMNYTIGSAAQNTSWTGEARKVIIKYTGTNKPIESLTVAYKKIELSTLSPLTLNEDDNDIAILENENTYANVTATRSMIADGGWYTFCVPFDIEDIATTPLKDAEIRKYKSMTGTTMNFEPTTSLKAMHAYLVKPTSNIVNPEFEDVLVVSEGDNVIDGENGYKFVGIYSKYPLALDGTNLFLGANNTFYLPTPEDYTLKALRGYFVVPEGTSASKMGINIDGETTSISALNTVDAISGKVYNLNGQYVGNNVKTLQKGIYVVNGKKIIIK